MRPLLPRLAVPLVVVLAACGGGEDSADDTPPSSPSTTIELATTTAPEPDPWLTLESDQALPRPETLTMTARYPRDFTEEQVEVVQALVDGHHALLATFDPPQPDSPLLSEHIDEVGAEANRQRVQRLLDANQVLRPPPNSRRRYTVVSATPSADGQVIVVCHLNDLEQIDQESGDLLNSGLRVTKYSYEFIRPEQGWLIKTDTVEQLQRWNGDLEEECIG